jgi:hypothetical protein
MGRQAMKSLDVYPRRTEAGLGRIPAAESWRIPAAGRGMSLCPIVAALLGTLSLWASAAGAEDLDSFLKKISSADEGARRAAWEGAAVQGPKAIAPLVAVASGENRDAALAALRAVDCISHASAAPGNASRREAAQALAAAVLDEKVPARVKQHLLDLLGSVGEGDVDSVVSAVAKILSDTELRDQARKALERIPGEAAAKAIEAALPRATGEWLEVLIHTLGTKKARCCVPALERIAGEGASGRVAAAMALTRIGDPESTRAIIGVLRSELPARERTLLTDDYLKMADDLRAAGNDEAARRIYSGVLRYSGDENPRYAALFALLGKGVTDADFETVMEAAEDSSAKIRRLAMDLLAKSRGADVDKLLVDRLASAQGSKKASLLRVLAERKAAGVDARIQAAIADPDIDVKVTALELSGKLGDPANEGVLLSAFEKASPPVKACALRAYLDLADARLAAEAPAAGKMYARALEAADEPGFKGRAIVGLGQVGDPAGLPGIEAARKDPSLVQSALQASVLYARALGKAGKKEEGIAMLTEVLSAGASRETIQSALAGLKDLGGDPTAFQKKQGFLASWWVVGPFPNDFGASYSPEEGVNLTAQKDDRGRTRKWAEFHSTNMDGKVDLRQAFQKSTEVSAYAYTEIEVPEAMDVRFKMGSDDGVALWLNKKKIHSNDVIRGLTVDEDVVDGRLEKGKNTILLKITQGGGEWEFTFRITDRQDKALDLTKFKSPGTTRV